MYIARPEEFRRVTSTLTSAPALMEFSSASRVNVKGSVAPQSEPIPKTKVIESAGMKRIAVAMTICERFRMKRIWTSQAGRTNSNIPPKNGAFRFHREQAILRGSVGVAEWQLRARWLNFGSVLP